MKDKTGVLTGSLKKVPYATGYMWAKVSKIKKGMDNQWRKSPLSSIDLFFSRVSERGADFFENAKYRTCELRESFIDGFKSGQRQPQTRARQIKEDAGDLRKPKAGARPAVSSKQKSARFNSDVRPKVFADSLKAEEIAQRLSGNDNDFEKEIEEIDRLVAEI